MGREFELKFAATAAQQSDIEAAYGDFKQITMASVYYDTPSRILAQKHITLRQRRENGIAVCTVKTPLSDGSRGEWELEWDFPETMVDALCKLGAPQELRALTSGGIEPVCGAEFVRKAQVIHLPDGVVELALDTGSLTGGDKRMPLCEVEVELKSGSDTAATAFAEELARTYGLQPEHRSKFSRAQALAKGE